MKGGGGGRDFFAGFVGGASGVVVGQPLDTLKVRLATNPYSSKSMFATATRMIRVEGLRSLFKGTLAPAFGYGIGVGIEFFRFQVSNRYFCDLLGCTRDELPLRYVCLSGGIGGFIGGIFLCPIELVKIQLQSTMVNRSNIQVIQHIYEQAGFRGFTKGLFAQLLRDTVGFAFYFGFYELTLRLWGKRSNAAILNAGGLAGVLSWALVYPLDGIKTRIQSTGWRKKNVLYKGIFDCSVQTIRKEGLKGVFRGFLPCCIRGYPQNAVTFFMYEYTLKKLRSRDSSIM